MATLYELTNDILDLYDMMEDPEGEEDVILDTLEAVLGDFDKKADNYAKLIKNMEADVEMYKAEIDKLTARKRVTENNVKRIKARLLECMKIAKYNELKGDVFSIKIRNNAKQLPEDIESNEQMIKLIPEEFYIPQDPKLDKRALLKAIKEEKVTGIELRESQSLLIK